MSERAPARRKRAKGAATTSLHFRMPADLRSRLQRFAEERSLDEAEALRLALSERLNEADDDRELEAAERWQFEQAWTTWQEYLRSGRRGGVPPEEIHRLFDEALGRLPPKQVRR
ncbi:MAG: hypothetical protein KGJ98_07370 [Chloroflexota bacterium]|nr:hypothetical protein [Chloroflexota bacterium]